MFHKLGYYTRWAMLVGSGAVVFQATGTCWDVIQTGSCPEVEPVALPAKADVHINSIKA